MERPDVPQTLTPPPGLQTPATATACFRAPSPVPPPQPQTTAVSSAVPELGLELSLNLSSQPIAATGYREHEFINFGDGGGDQIGSGMDVFSIFGDEGEAHTQTGVDLFAIFGDEEEAATENADAVMNSVEAATENADAVMNSVEAATVKSVDGEGAVAGSRSDAFLLFGDEEGATAGSGFDSAMLFGDDEGAATETGMQAEGDTPVDGLNTVVDAENVGRADRLVVPDSIGDALDSSETDRPEITNTGMPLMNPPDVSDEWNNRKKRRSMADLVIGTDLGMDGLGNEEGVAEMNQGERNEVHDSGDADGAGVEVEGAVSTQRARKKSKYLSPPYTNPSWNDMKTALHGDANALVPWSPKKGKGSTSSSLFPSSLTKGKGSSDKMSKGKGSSDKMSKGKGSNDKISPSATYTSVDVNVLLSDLLSLAVHHYHLKGSRSQRTFRSFYEEFRCSQFLCLDLGDDKVHPVDSETLARGVGDRSKGKATRTSNKGKDGAVPEAATPLNLNLGKVKLGSATTKKKVTKSEVDGQGPLNLANSSLGKRKANTSGMPIPESTGHDPFEFSEEGDSPKKRKSNGAALAVAPLNSRDPNGLPEGGRIVSTRLTKSNQSWQKKGSKINKKGKSSARKTGKGSKGDTSQQKRKIEEALSGCPAALIMTFSPGSTLPSRDELVSTFSVYGDLIEPNTELLEDSCSACVVFAKSSDAEKAFNSPNKKTAFRSPLAGCRLRYLLESMPSSSAAGPLKKTPRPSPAAEPLKKTPSPSPAAEPPSPSPAAEPLSPSPAAEPLSPSPAAEPLSPSPAAEPLKKTPSPSPAVQSVKKTPSPSSAAQSLKKALRPSSSVAQPVRNTPHPSRLVTQRFKKTPLPNIRKTLERLLRSLIGPFSVGQSAGTAEWMKLEGMEELAGDMKALLEKIDGILTQPPPATSH